MAATLAVVGARIRTLDPRRPYATAIAVRHGIITAVGDDAEVRAHCDARTDVLRAAGQTLVPGLVDAHLHPFWGAELTRGTDLSGCRTPLEVHAALATAARRTGPGDWVFAYGLDYDALPPDGLQGSLLDAAVGEAPALVRLSDLHTALASSRALELAAVDGPRRFADAHARPAARARGQRRAHAAPARPAAAHARHHRRADARPAAPA